ncbi:hypothetical protein ACHAWO_006950 [Cyclotella atomus]|uniref:Uncharacterized protein n=1 Tax=Cyclotella atomus TaxID=382360 RepID=A0ABD3Q6Z8_9STRA
MLTVRCVAVIFHDFNDNPLPLNAHNVWRNVIFFRDEPSAFLGLFLPRDDVNSTVVLILRDQRVANRLLWERTIANIGYFRIRFTFDVARRQFNQRQIDDILRMESDRRQNDDPRLIIQEECELIRVRDEEERVLGIIARQDVIMREGIADAEAQQRRDAAELALLQEQAGEAELELAQMEEEEQAALEAIGDQDAEMEEDIADAEAQQRRDGAKLALLQEQVGEAELELAQMEEERFQEELDSVLGGIAQQLHGAIADAYAEAEEEHQQDTESVASTQLSPDLLEETQDAYDEQLTNSFSKFNKFHVKFATYR